MVAPGASTAEANAEQPLETGTYAQRTPIRARSALQRLFLSLTRVLSIQTQLTLLHAKMAAQRVVLFAIMYAIGAGIALAGLVFLYIGCFKLLCLVMADYWAFLVFAGLHGAAAAGLFMTANAKLRAAPRHADAAGPPADDAAGSVEPESREATL